MAQSKQIFSEKQQVEGNFIQNKNHALVLRKRAKTFKYISIFAFMLKILFVYLINIHLKLIFLSISSFLL